MENLAQIGSLRPEYVGMLALVENRTPPRDLPADSELKLVEGSLQGVEIDYCAKILQFMFQSQQGITS